MNDLLDLLKLQRASCPNRLVALEQGTELRGKSKVCVDLFTALCNFLSALKCTRGGGGGCQHPQHMFDGAPHLSSLLKGQFVQFLPPGKTIPKAVRTFYFLNSYV